MNHGPSELSEQTTSLICELCEGTGRIWSWSAGVNAVVNTVCYVCKGTGKRNKKKRHTEGGA